MTDMNTLTIKTKVTGAGTIWPPTATELDAQIAVLQTSGEKPEKLAALIAVRATLEP